MKHKRQVNKAIYFHRAHTLSRGNIITGFTKKENQPKGIIEKLRNEYDEKFQLLKGLKIKQFQIQVKNGKKPNIEPIGRLKFEEALEKNDSNTIKELIKELDKKILLVRKIVDREVEGKKLIEERKIAFIKVIERLGGVGFDEPLNISGINFPKYYIEIFPQDWATKNGSLRSWWKGEYGGVKIRFGISLKSSDIVCHTSTEKEPAQFISAKQLINYVSEIKERVDSK